MHHLQCVCVCVCVFRRPDKVPVACPPAIQSVPLAAYTRTHRVPTAILTGRLDTQLGD